jgi:hypothetical protein
MNTNVRETREPTYDAWNQVQTAFEEANRLYLREMTAYLDWTQNLQKEILEQAWSTAQIFSRAGDESLAFWNRVRQSIPAPGAVPKGTATISGMVHEIVKATTNSTE